MQTAATTETARQEATTIYRQISPATKMALGARDFVCGSSLDLDCAGKGMSFLWFTIGRPSRKALRKLIVCYDYQGDCYVVVSVSIDLKSYKTMILEEHEGVYVESLNELLRTAGGVAS